MSLRNEVIEKTLPKAGKELGWAGYIWNPITKTQEGKLMFHKDRIKLPLTTEDRPRTSKWDQMVLVCSEIDLIDEEVPPSWLSSMYEVMGETSFMYMFLTRKPELYSDSSLPRYGGIGVCVSNQTELMNALKVMVEMPMDESRPACMSLVFESLTVEYQIPKTRDGYSSLKYVDWIVIKRDAAGEDDWRNVETLLHHARKGRCGVYFEPGMLARPTDPPIPLVPTRKRSEEDKFEEKEFCARIKAFEEREELDKRIELRLSESADDDMEGTF